MFFLLQGKGRGELGCGGGGVLGLIFAGYVPLASQSPSSIIVYSVANYRPVSVTFGQMCNFPNPKLSYFLLMCLCEIE